MFMGNYCFFHTGNYYDYEQLLFFFIGATTMFMGNYFFLYR